VKMKVFWRGSLSLARDEIEMEGILEVFLVSVGSFKMIFWQIIPSCVADFTNLSKRSI
jgi:hypothetical protein